MPEIFTTVPPPEPLSSTTTAEGPTQIETDMKRGPTTTTAAPEAVPSPATPAGIVYVSTTCTQAMVQRQARTES